MSGRIRAAAMHITVMVCLFLILSLGRSWAGPGLQEMGFLVDRPGTLAADRVLSEASRLAFTPSPSGSFNFGISDHTVWIRARIPDLEKGLSRPVFYINSPGLMAADLYLPVKQGAGTGHQHIPGGLLPGRSPLDWGYRFMVFELPLETLSGEWLYFRVNAGGHTANFTMALSDPSRLRQTSWMETGILCLGVGVLLGMVLYNTFLYLFLQDKSYLLYVIYILGIALYQVCHSGVGRIFGMPVLINYAIPVSALVYVFAMAFIRQFLNTRKHAPKSHICMTLLMVLSVIAVAVWGSGAVALSNQMTHAIGALGPLIAISVGVVRIRQGFYPARYYLAAWSALCIAVLVLVLVGMKLLPYNFVTYNAYVLGSGLEAVLLSMALGDRIRMMQRERRRLQEHKKRLTELAITDELTGLYNKRGYTEKFSREMAEARMSGRELSLLVLDIDHFKSFNDTFGHSAGDRLLSAMGDLIIRNIRARDIPCRFGGEEFVILLPDISLSRATAIAQRLCVSARDLAVDLGEGKSKGCTVSIGVASLAESDDPEALFERADKAMYQAKKEGRNQVCSR